MDMAVWAVFGILVINNILLIKQIDTLQKALDHNLGSTGNVCAELQALRERLDRIHNAILNRSIINH